MNGFKPGDDSCALHKYGAIVQFLDGNEKLSEGEKADLEFEYFSAMGSCTRECIEACMAHSFNGNQMRPMPHTRHLQVPSIWTVEGDIREAAEVETVVVID